MGLFGSEDAELKISANMPISPTFKKFISRLSLFASVLIIILIAAVSLLAAWFSKRERDEQIHFDREETELIVANAANAPLHLFKAGKNLQDTTRISTFSGERFWLPRGNYFLQTDLAGHNIFMPVPIAGYRRGPEDDGSLAVTVRSLPREFPTRLSSGQPEFVYVPSGYFLLGDRLNPTEPHYVRLGAFFISPFEVSNAEFREFLKDPVGYADTSNWTRPDKDGSRATRHRAPRCSHPKTIDFRASASPINPSRG